MNKKALQIHKISAIINGAVLAVAVMGMMTHCLPIRYGSIPVLVMLISGTFAIFHWWKYADKTSETKVIKSISAVLGLAFGTIMLIIAVSSLVEMFAIIIYAIIGISYGYMYVKGTNEAIEGIVGLIFGICMLAFGVFSTGGGHYYGLFYLLTAPAGILMFISFGSYFLVAVWWSLMFFLASKTRKRNFPWYLFVIGECLYFAVLAYGIMNLQAEWSSWLDPYIWRVYAIPLAIYILGRVYMVRLLLREKSSVPNKRA